MIGKEVMESFCSAHRQKTPYRLKGLLQDATEKNGYILPDIPMDKARWFRLCGETAETACRGRCEEIRLT